MRVRIDVTEGDIARGARCVGTRCAVALAVRRAFPEYGFVIAGPGVITAHNLPRPGGFTVKTPPAVSDFIGKFDGLLRVEPFSFEIEVPDPA